MVGAPLIKLPPKWSLKIGKYMGSWADAADSESEDDYEPDSFSD